MSLPWASKRNYSAGIPVDVVETAFEHCWERTTSDLLRLRVGTCLRRNLCMSLTAQKRFFLAMAHVVDSANETVLGAFLLVSLNQPLITAARRILRNLWGSMLPLVYWSDLICWVQRTLRKNSVWQPAVMLFERMFHFNAFCFPSILSRLHRSFSRRRMPLTAQSKPRLVSL